MSPDRKPAKRTARTVPAGCLACGVTYPAPHKPDCTAVAAEKQHAQAVRDAWESGGLKPPCPTHTPGRVVPRDSEDELCEHQQKLLRVSLNFAVPLWVQRFRDEGRTLESLMALGPKLADVLGSQGTALMWRQKAREEKRLPDGTPVCERQLSTAELFNRLAEGIAAASFVPGGVKAFGGHWESKPEWLKQEGA